MGIIFFFQNEGYDEKKYTIKLKTQLILKHFMQKYSLTPTIADAVSVTKILFLTAIGRQ